MINRPRQNRTKIIFVYDGECPICTYAAEATRIQKNIGDLELIDARNADQSHHPVFKEITDERLDLDEGMVIKYQGKFYHGQNALKLMAKLAAPENWFNRTNRLLFQNDILSRLGYPLIRGVRNLLLRALGVKKIKNLEKKTANPAPLFKKIFGDKWSDLPAVFHIHYAPRPGTTDLVRAEGKLDVKVSPFVSIMARITGALIPYSGKDIPVTVTFWCGDNGSSFHFDRAFHYPAHGTYHFRSKMLHTKDNELIEFIKFGIGWRLSYNWEGEKIILRHLGYVWRIMGLDIPIPMALILGQGYAEETAISHDRFQMWTHAKHALFGEMLAYSGEFQVKDVTCKTTS